MSPTVPGFFAAVAVSSVCRSLWTLVDDDAAAPIDDLVALNENRVVLRGPPASTLRHVTQAGPLR